MGFLPIFLTGVGLSMDAFAVSICKGLCMPKFRMPHALVIALFFGAFQAIMTLIGWALGSSFAALIEPVDHWIAFVLLALVGAKMLVDAYRGEGEANDEGEGEGAGAGAVVAAGEGADASAGEGASAGTSEGAERGSYKLDFRELFMLAIATSIDALAVGISFALLSVNIALAALAIGLITFALSLAGVAIGHTFGARFNKWASVVGGIVLIAIGLKILLEHLGVFA